MEGNGSVFFGRVFRFFFGFYAGVVVIYQKRSYKTYILFAKEQVSLFLIKHTHGLSLRLKPLRVHRDHLASFVAANDDLMENSVNSYKNHQTNNEFINNKFVVLSCSHNLRFCREKFP